MTHSHRVLITEKFSTEALTALQNAQTNSTNIALEIHKLSPAQKINELTPEQLNQFTGLIIRSKTLITSDLLVKMPQLQFIITCTNGYDHIDLIATQKRNIKVMYTANANTQSAAELTWALILAAHRPIIAAHENIKKDHWNRELFEGTELSGKTLGIVGLGRIGQKVARIAKAFDMQIVAFDPYQQDHAFNQLQIERSSYEEVLKQADILSFHVPLTSETRNMFNRNHLDYTSDDIVIINTSRGSVVNEEDLLEALENKQFKAAALDVFTEEPLPKNSKLRTATNVILTPHIGALTEQAFKKASQEACNLCIEFIKNNNVKEGSLCLPL